MEADFWARESSQDVALAEVRVFSPPAPLVAMPLASRAAAGAVVVLAAAEVVVVLAAAAVEDDGGDDDLSGFDMGAAVDDDGDFDEVFFTAVVLVVVARDEVEEVDGAAFFVVVVPLDRGISDSLCLLYPPRATRATQFTPLRRDFLLLESPNGKAPALALFPPPRNHTHRE